MRIDKWLKVSRIMKRRTVSRELARNQRVEINGKQVKPAHEVKTGDEVSVLFGSRKITVRVLSTSEVKRKKDAAEMYEVLREERVESAEEMNEE